MQPPQQKLVPLQKAPLRFNLHRLLHKYLPKLNAANELHAAHTARSPTAKYKKTLPPDNRADGPRGMVGRSAKLAGRNIFGDFVSGGPAGICGEASTKLALNSSGS